MHPWGLVKLGNIVSSNKLLFPPWLNWEADAKIESMKQLFLLDSTAFSCFMDTKFASPTIFLAWLN